MKGAEFDFVREAFEDYALNHWTGALALRNRRIDSDLLAHSKWEPEKHARARLGVSPARMQELVTTGEIRAAQRKTQTGRTFSVVHRDDVIAKFASVTNEFTLAGAASVLGLKRSRLASLLPHICPVASQTVRGQSKWAIPHSWVKLWTLRITALPTIAIPTGAKSLGELLRFKAWPPWRIGRLISDIELGLLSAIGRLLAVDGLPAMLFESNTLKKWSESNGHQRGALTVPQVAQRLKIKQEVAYLLVRRSLLKSTKRRDGSRTSTWITESQFDQFNRKYVWCRDVAARLGKSPRWAAVLLERMGIKQASGPLTDQGRQILYLQSDLIGILPEMTAQGDQRTINV